MDTGQEQSRHPMDSNEYATLMRHYGEAMFRIGQLEARLDNIARLIEKGNIREISSPAATQAPSSNAGEVPDKATLAGSPVTRTPERRYEEEIQQLRLQLTSMAQQLAQTGSQVKDLNDYRSRHRHHRKHRPLWRKALNAFGIAKLSHRSE